MMDLERGCLITGHSGELCMRCMINDVTIEKTDLEIHYPRGGDWLKKRRNMEEVVVIDVRRNRVRRYGAKFVKNTHNFHCISSKPDLTTHPL
jgi:hypothetical protein